MCFPARRRPALPPPAALAPNRSRSGPSTSWPSTADRWSATCNTKPTGPFPRPRPDAGRPRRPGPRRGPLGDHRRRARPDFQPASRVRIEPEASVRVAFTTAAPNARGGADPGRPVPRFPRRHPRLRAGLGAQPGRAAAPAPVRRGSPPVSASGRPRHLRRGRPAGRAGRAAGQRRASRACGGTASPATGRSSWCASPRPDELAAGPPAACGPHAYWRLKGLEVDLVILNEHPRATSKTFNTQLLNLVRASECARPDRQAGRRLRAQDDAPVARTTASCCRRRPASCWPATAARWRRQMDRLERAAGPARRQTSGNREVARSGSRTGA